MAFHMSSAFVVQRVRGYHATYVYGGEMDC